MKTLSDITKGPVFCDKNYKVAFYDNALIQEIFI